MSELRGPDRPEEGFEVGEEPQGWFEKLLARTMGLALAGFFALLAAAVLAGPDSWVAYATAAVFIGPFFAAAFVMLGAFFLSLILYGEPDRFVEKLFSDGETDA